jgi:predicted GTPase
MTLKLKKAWVWLKKHWYVPVMAIILFVFLVLCPLCASTDNKILQMFKLNKESYKKEIDAINKAQEEKDKRQTELYAKYTETMKNLTTEHNIDMDTLEDKQRKELDTLVKKYKGTPDELARELGEIFGVDYVE